jgi:hypothetical protein
MQFQNYQSLSCDFIVKLEFEQTVRLLQETRDTVLARRYYKLFNHLIDMRYDVASDQSDYLGFLKQKILQLRELKLKKRHDEAVKIYLQISHAIRTMVDYFTYHLQKYDSSICHPDENSPFNIELKFFDPFGCKS